MKTNFCICKITIFASVGHVDLQLKFVKITVWKGRKSDSYVQIEILYGLCYHCLIYNNPFKLRTVFRQ